MPRGSGHNLPVKDSRICDDITFGRAGSHRVKSIVIHNMSVKAFVLGNSPMGDPGTLSALTGGNALPGKNPIHNVRLKVTKPKHYVITGSADHNSYEGKTFAGETDKVWAPARTADRLV